MACDEDGLPAGTCDEDRRPDTEELRMGVRLDEPPLRYLAAVALYELLGSGALLLFTICGVVEMNE